jgi:GDP-mannose 6-dehydrogenase
MAVEDFRQPTRVVIGELDATSGDVLSGVYHALDAPIVRTTLRIAEMVKYADNAFHALKVAFANEIGGICAALGIDSHAVMDIFALDTKLNLGRAYLQPGFAFGGSCLPKDLRALIHQAQLVQAEGPLLPAVLASNDRQKMIAVEMVRRTGRKKIGVLGLSFKSGTDDLRESPAVELIEQLLADGCDIAVYDPFVAPAALIGSNRSYIERELPHLSALMRATLDEVVAGAEVLVVTTKNDEFGAILEQLRPEQKVIDLVRIRRDCAALGAQYAGISW